MSERFLSSLPRKNAKKKKARRNRFKKTGVARWRDLVLPPPTDPPKLALIVFFFSLILWASRGDVAEPLRKRHQTTTPLCKPSLEHICTTTAASNTTGPPRGPAFENPPAASTHSVPCCSSVRLMKDSQVVAQNAGTLPQIKRLSISHQHDACQTQLSKTYKPNHTHSTVLPLHTRNVRPAPPPRRKNTAHAGAVSHKKSMDLHHSSGRGAVCARTRQNKKTKKQLKTSFVKKHFCAKVLMTKGVLLNRRKLRAGCAVEGAFLPYRRRYSWVACNDDTDPWWSNLKVMSRSLGFCENEGHGGVRPAGTASLGGLSQGGTKGDRKHTTASVSEHLAIDRSIIVVPRETCDHRNTSRNRKGAKKSTSTKGSGAKHATQGTLPRTKLHSSILFSFYVSIAYSFHS